MKFSDTKYGDLTGQIYNGSIDVSRIGLNSLEGTPKEINGHFGCSNNLLTSLEGAPEKVNGNFYCSGNRLTSLKFSPEKVSGSFYCSSNRLTSLDDLLPPYKNIVSDFSDSEVNEYYKTNFPQYLI